MAEQWFCKPLTWFRLRARRCRRECSETGASVCRTRHRTGAVNRRPRTCRRLARLPIRQTNLRDAWGLFLRYACVPRCGARVELRGRGSEGRAPCGEPSKAGLRMRHHGAKPARKAERSEPKGSLAAGERRGTRPGAPGLRRLEPDRRSGGGKAERSEPKGSLAAAATSLSSRVGLRKLDAFCVLRALIGEPGGLSV